MSKKFTTASTLILPKNDASQDRRWGACLITDKSLKLHFSVGSLCSGADIWSIAIDGLYNRKNSNEQLWDYGILAMAL
jgi:hypothetical protein